MVMMMTIITIVMTTIAIITSLHETQKGFRSPGFLRWGCRVSAVQVGKGRAITLTPIPAFKNPNPGPRRMLCAKEAWLEKEGLKTYGGSAFGA